jgi:branched-chain amino acid transport system permease protein
VSDISQIVVSGLTNGAVYALIGLALSLTFACTHIMNFALGDMLMVGAMLAYQTMTVWGQPPWVAILEILAIGLALGFVTYWGVAEPIARRGGPLTATFALLGVSAILIGGAQLLISNNTESVDPFISGQVVHVFRTGLFPQAVFLILFTVVLGVVMAAVLRWTPYGLASRAIAQDREAAALMGIRSRRLLATTFAVSTLLAVFSGVLLSGLTSVDATMGSGYVLTGLLGVMIGGAMTPVGAMLGGFVVGLVESLSTQWLPSSVDQAVGFALLMIVLVVRPSGLFGRARVERVG